MKNEVKISEYTIVEFEHKFNNSDATHYRTTLNDEGRLNDDSWEFLVGDSWETYYLYSQSCVELVDYLKKKFYEKDKPKKHEINLTIPPSGISYGENIPFSVSPTSSLIEEK